MRNVIIGIVAIVLVGIGLFFVFNNNNNGDDTAQDSAPETQATPLPPIVDSSLVVAEGEVLPIQSANLNFQTSGIVADILVEEGAVVEENTPIARLDIRDLELAVERARINLTKAKINYDKLLEGPTPEEISAAQARLEQAQAQLLQTRGGVTEQDIAAARAELEEARAQLAKLEKGSDEEDIRSARAKLEQAQVNLETQIDTLSEAKTRARLNLERSANELRNAQDSYSQIYWENRELEDQLARFGDELPQKNKDDEAAALRAVQNAEITLQEAQVAYEQAQQAENNGIASAKAQVRDAQAALDKLLSPADEDELAAARARIARTESQLAKLIGEEREGSVSSSEANVRNAEAQLAQLTAKPRDTELEEAMAQISEAELALREAELALDKATLRAPFAGTVAEINLKVGELPDATADAVVMADFSQWKIETTDLTEISIVRVREGDTVSFTLDALPGEEFTGTVTEIKAIGKNRQGDITYTVVVMPDQQDEQVRWNMTAAVMIEPQD